MKKEPKKSPRNIPIDFSNQKRICHMAFCAELGINPYIFEEEIIFYCDKDIPSRNGGKQ